MGSERSRGLLVICLLAEDVPVIVMFGGGSGVNRRGSVIAPRLETLVIARAFTVTKPCKPAAIAGALRRFTPTNVTDVAFREAVSVAVTELRNRGILEPHNLLTDPDELSRQIGTHGARRWQQLSDRFLPALALGIAPDDTKSHGRLKTRDDWAAAIVGRALGLWDSGPPPSLAVVCDRLAWRELGLPGKPKKCPAEIRAYFVQQQLSTEPGSPARQVRLLAAREVDAARAEPRALRDALVRGWLTGRALGTSERSSFAQDVRGVAGNAREGVFGDRKVFISAVWDTFRRHPAWSSVTLGEFKTRLVSAHRAGELSLARADLVAAMDPALVAASETTTDGASFHFIVREEPS